MLLIYGTSASNNGSALELGDVGRKSYILGLRLMILKTVSLLLETYWQNLTFLLFEAVEWFVTEEGSKTELKEVKGRGGGETGY